MLDKLIGLNIFNISPTSHATLLMNGTLGNPAFNASNPLTPTEWGDFAAWMRDQEIKPEDLLNGELPKLLKTWRHPNVTISRIQGLLDRAEELVIALERWKRAGIWVLTRADSAYPSLLKNRLGRTAPAILYGCGNPQLLSITGVAIVGMRYSDSSEIAFADRLGRCAAERQKLVISGGAIGVDQTAMRATLVGNGRVIGVLSQNLARTSTQRMYRRHLIDGNLVLVSPFDPDMGFTVANAMERNKYIYCLAHHAIVVSSTFKKGGTWNGAVENLRNQWVPLLVRRTKKSTSGNSELVRLGGRWFGGTQDLDFD